MGVSMGPGQMAFTLIPRWAYATASDRVRPTTACLVAL